MSDKREQIESVAAQAIQQDGVRSVSFRTLADAVGVKSASVHYHFPTKADLARAVVERYAEHFQSELERIERRHRTLTGKLRAFVGVFETVLANDSLCLCGMMAAEVTSLDDETRRALGRFFADAEAWLERTIVAHENEVTFSLKPKALAKALMSGLEGAMLLDRVDQGTRLDAMRALVKVIGA